MSSPSAAATTANGGNGSGGGIDTIKDTYIPVFNNKPEDYREWRQRINLYKKKLSLQGKDKEAVINLLTSLQGVAWRQVEHQVDKLMEDADGFKKTLELLDAAFRYDARVEMPRALEKFFYTISRKSDQTLLTYVSDHREALREVEKHGIQIPENVSGWLLLRRSGLTTEQKQLIQSRCGDLKDYEVEQAMYYLLGQDYKTRVQPMMGGKGRPHRWQRSGHGYVAEEDVYYDDEWDYVDDNDEDAYYEELDGGSYAEAEAYEDPYAYEESALYETEDGDYQDDGDPQLEEAYAAYLDARRQFANIKAARGYYPVVALAPGSDGPSTSSQMPRSPKGKGKGGFPRRKGKGKGKGRGSPPQKGSAKSRAQTVMDQRCFRCGATDHLSSSCPKPPSSSTRASTTPSSSPSKKHKIDGSGLMVRDLTTDDAGGPIPRFGSQGCFGIQDSGASSVVVGHNILMQYIDYMYGRGVPADMFRFLATNKTFGFGGDTTRRSDWSCRLPVWIEGQHGFMECFVVDGSTPLLVGRPLLQAFRVQINYDTSQQSVMGSPWRNVVSGERGEHLLRLDDGIGGRNCQDDPICFDYVTDDSLTVRTNYEDLDSYISLEEYLSTTLREPPEHALRADEDHAGEEETPVEPSPEPEDYTPTSEIVLDDPTAVRRNITDKLIKTMHMHFNVIGKRRAAVIEQAMLSYKKRKKTFWEVYSGSAGLAQLMSEFGWTVRTFDLLNGWDFEVTSHRRRFLELLDEECPDVVWWAPPCTKWSPLQNLNALTEDQKFALEADREYEEKIHLRFVRRGYEKQYREGRHGGIEQPALAKSWGTRTFTQLSGEPCALDQCAYGAVLPDENGVLTPIKKPTRLQLTSRFVARLLNQRCTQDHEHLPIEGSSPGIGNRAAASAAYQEGLCEAIAEAFDRLYAEFNEPCYFNVEDENDEHEEINYNEGEEEAGGDEDYEPSIAPEEEPEPPQPRGVLYKLGATRQQEVKRTITRLHRNLGHPTNNELAKMLEQRGASPELVEAARIHDCATCHLHQRPSSVPVSSIPKTTAFNERVQVDTLWITPPDSRRAFPVLMMSDAMTRLLSARLLSTEDSGEFIRAIEKGWLRSFGPMKILQVDEHRAWSSERVRAWCSENGIELIISPGQSHSRLGILERRHQVTKRATMLFMQDNPAGERSAADYVIYALNYVIPQINRMPNVKGFSPIQWTLGYTPHIPGLLMEEQTANNPAQLDPSQQFMEKLRLQQSALKATSEADLDRRLRRALLRKFTGQVRILNTGDKCYYWRDAPAGAGTKLRWKGPAVVVMRESSPIGPHADIYWIAHGTVLLRAAPEHVKPADPRPVVDEGSTPLDRAKQALQQVRGRGVTQFIDLPKSNKRKRLEVDSDEEEEDLDMPPALAEDDEPLLQDEWSTSHEGRYWVRHHRVPRKALYMPDPEDGVPVHCFGPSRVTSIQRLHPAPEHIRLRDDWTADDASRELHYTWTGTTTFRMVQNDYFDEADLDDLFKDFGDDAPDDDDGGPSGSGGPAVDGKLLPSTTMAMNNADNAGALLPVTQQPPAQITYPMPETGIPHTAIGLEETTTIPRQPQPPQQVEHDNPQPASVQDQPSSTPPTDTTSTPILQLPEELRDVYEPKENETFEQQRLRVSRQETLPFQRPEPYGPVREATSRTTPYSKVADEETHVTVDADVMPTTKLPPGWKVENGYMVLEQLNDDWVITDKHLIRRHFLPRNKAFVPTEENCPIHPRFLHKSRVTRSAGQVLNDKWTRPSTNRQLHECWWTGTTQFKIQTPWKSQAYGAFMAESDGFETINAVADGGQISERYMSLADRKLFTEAKQKELESFFNNQVWHFSPSKEADPERVLKARFLLNWKKNADGSPRAKARLIVQGFRDPDALNGTLNTASPTLTRLSRNFILTMATMQGFDLFTADITTAFLQGKEFPDGSDRVIWIKLPRDGERLLGLEGEHGQLMKLTKPMYGLCDAPRAWFEEATERILNVGGGKIVQHPLDACLFMAYSERPSDACPSPMLLGMFGLHVDDLFGCLHPTDKVAKELQEKIHKSFSFREWIVGDKLEYCGSSVEKIGDNHWKVSHEKYMAKQKPISIPKERLHQDLPVTESERTQLRGLLGALQWPATQTSPHLQAGVSLLCGDVTKATTKTLESANKLLRFAKSNADVGLEFRHLADKENVTFVAYSDASFACRSDLSSQGGYMVAMVSREVAEGQAGHYVVVDWRSWKLQRVARSTLCAESQAASEAADALLYTSTFWNLVWSPQLLVDAPETSQMPVRPRLIVDAKALYDLLVKPEEVQAASNSDKRTTIEVLVTQDKLACNKAKTMWVSSELQYADGLTKDSAAQLLADRLRSHLTKLKADETFQAAKKKDAAQRKKNAEMYAVKKPKRAMKALLATVLWSTCAGQGDREPIIYIDQTNDLVLYLLVTIIVILLGNTYLPGFGQRVGKMLKYLFRRELPEPELEPEEPPEAQANEGEREQNTREVGVQAVADEVDLYREIHHHTNRANFYLKELEDLRTRVEVDHTRRQTEYREKIQEMHGHMTQQTIYITRNGECWHADYTCATRRTLNQVYGRRPCQACSRHIAKPGNHPPEDVEVDYGDVDAAMRGASTAAG